MLKEIPAAKGTLASTIACYKRIKSTYATPLVTALADGLTSGMTEYDAMIVDIGEWDTANDTANDTLSLYNVATEYKALIEAEKTTADTGAAAIDTAAENSFNSAKA